MQIKRNSALVQQLFFLTVVNQLIRKCTANQPVSPLDAGMSRPLEQELGYSSIKRDRRPNSNFFFFFFVFCFLLLTQQPTFTPRCAKRWAAQKPLSVHFYHFVLIPVPQSYQEVFVSHYLKAPRVNQKYLFFPPLYTVWITWCNLVTLCRLGRWLSRATPYSK